MDINAGIIDQQLTGLLEKHPEWLQFGKDEDKKRSAAFILLCMTNCLDIPLEESIELLTEGGNDAGVDGLHIGDVEDGEFLVTLFQGKYKKDLEGKANFPENGVEKAVNTIQVLFDPFRKVTLNEKIAPKVEEIRSLIRDGYIPKVHFVLCNNGICWNDTAQAWIDELNKTYPDKVEFTHFNHNSIVEILQRTKAVDASLQLSGQLIVEDMNYMRVIIGRILVSHIADLFEQHGERLLQRNIRRYLGLNNNRVNSAIHETLCSDKSDKFYFYNNGITVTCDKFEYNAFQKNDHKVQLKNMQIINGGQTCKTIHETLKFASNKSIGESAYVMIRIYQLSDEEKEFIQDITYATNSQNPVDLRDLKSNDPIQKQLETGISNLGYTYKRQREEGGSGSNIITSSVVAEATLAIWRKRPHQAKFRHKELFGKLYDDIFKNLNAAQALLAVFIFRDTENERKRPSTDNPKPFLPYASHYIAMLIGCEILQTFNIASTEISHQNFTTLLENFQKRKEELHANALSKIEQALKQCYGDRDISLQQLSATFRGGDLLEILNNIQGQKC